MSFGMFKGALINKYNTVTQVSRWGLQQIIIITYNIPDYSHIMLELAVPLTFTKMQCTPLDSNATNECDGPFLQVVFSVDSNIKLMLNLRPPMQRLHIDLKSSGILI